MMTRILPRPLRPVAALALGTLLLTACKDSSGPAEARVATVEAVSGDQQQAVVATALPQPVVARALDAQSRPVRRAKLQWQVVSGAGTITGTATETDGEGRATANWTLGTGAGEQVVSLNIGTASLTFHATASPGPAATVTITPSPVTLDAIGATSPLTMNARDAHNNVISGRTGTWTSANTAIVTVDNNGVVTAKSQGSTKVRVTLDDKTGETDVNVQPLPATIFVDPPAPQFAALGATVQFQASAQDRNGNPVVVPPQNYTWSSSNTAIVAVNPTGLATAQANGIALIRAAVGNVTGQAQATVRQVTTSMTLSPQNDTLTTARPVTQLTVAARDANNQPIAQPTTSFISTNTAVATVAPTGVVTALSNGTTRIRATSGTASDSATITVRLNTAPKAVADSVVALKDTQLNVAAPGLLTNDTLGIPAGAIVSFGGGSLGGTVTSNGAGTTASFGTAGTLRVNTDGSLSFKPSTGFTGTFTFVYRVQNLAGVDDDTVTIQVGVAPAATADAYNTPLNVTLNVVAPGLRANDTPGFPVATVISFGGLSLTGDVTSFAAGQTVAFGVGGFIGGVVTVHADGSLSFKPPTGFTGTFSFQYRLGNGIATSDASITITVM
jgi:uncharacterized protein YjdB